MIVLIGAGVLGAWHTAVGAQGESGASVWDGVYTAAQAQRGKELYDGGCASCHGGDLDGLEVGPALIGGAFRWNWNATTLADLYDRIHKLMPPGAPEQFSEKEGADILAYVLSCNKMPAGETDLPTETDRLKMIRFDADKK
jgi:quinoprotein glucose dehydrogenase